MSGVSVPVELSRGGFEANMYRGVSAAVQESLRDRGIIKKVRTMLITLTIHKSNKIYKYYKYQVQPTMYSTNAVRLLNHLPKAVEL